MINIINRKKKVKEKEKNLTIVGKHQVRNVLLSPFFDIKKLFALSEYQKDKELEKILKQKKIPSVFLNREKFSSLNLEKRNQGIMLVASCYKYVLLTDLLRQRSRNRWPLFVALDKIEDPQNFGAIVRVSAALNIDGIIILDRGQVQVNSTIIKVSAGGISYVPICRVSNLEKTLKSLSQNGFKIVSTVCNKNALSYEDLEYVGPICLVFGNEGDGIGKTIIKNSDALIYIPMYNNMASLNVSVSCGIICSKVISCWKNK